MGKKAVTRGTEDSAKSARRTRHCSSCT